jgi:hypothetical protein
MVAYSFNKGFVAPIRAGTKRQTIRLPRKRHARPGEELQLFTGMRTKRCELIGRATCTGVHDVRLDFVAGTVTIDDGLMLVLPADLDEFALRDGFQPRVDTARRPWPFMRAWWRQIHPGLDVFNGVLIRWEALR